MAKVIITESYLEDIADAIRTKTGSSDTYNPSEMAPAILSISGGGGITPTGTINITSNGTYNVTSYASAEVAVPTGSTINNQNKSVTPTESAQTVTYDSGYTGLESVSVGAISKTYVGSSIARKSSTDLTVSGATVTAPAGYYSANASKAVAIGSAGTPTATKGTVSNHSVSITPSVTNTTGYIAGSTKTGTAVTVSASELVSGTKSITANGTSIDVINYASVDVNVGGGSSPIINNLTITPTESEQTFNGNASGTPLISHSMKSGTGHTYTFPTPLSVGTTYHMISTSYNEDSQRQVTSEADFVCSATDITVCYHIIINNISMYGDNNQDRYYVEIYEATVDGYLPVTVSAISSTYVGSGITRRSSTDLSTSGATVTVPAGYYASQATKSVSTGSATGPTSLSRSSATISTGTNTITLTKTGVSTTPTVSAGYILSATSSSATVALTASVTVNPTPTASGKTVTIPAGYYSAQATKDVDTMTLPTSASASATSGYTSKATISRSTSDQYINIPTGYNTDGGYYKINAIANGSATGPSSLSGSSASVSTGTNTLTLTKTGVTTTPTVSAGYVSGATASTATVTLTASVTTKAATTYNTSTTDQTISSGTYLTGTQTIKAVTVSGLSADKILSGTTVKIGDANDDDRIASVSGSVTLTTVYTGSGAPSSSLGSNNDIYIQS